MKTMQTLATVLVATWLCTGCAAALGGPTGFPSTDHFAASMETPLSPPHAADVVVREPRTFAYPRERASELVQCAQCR